jgi:hypothetical protein
VAGRWRKLHNEERNDMNYSAHIIRMIKSRRMNLTGCVARMERRGTRIGTGGKPKHMWIDHIKMDLGEMG